MPSHNVVLLLVATLLASANALLATEKTECSSLRQLRIPGSNQGRHLRSTMISEPNGDERSNPVSALMSKISAKIPMGMKLTFWQMLGISDDYVKAKLGLTGLEGAELKAHKNYRRFEKYVETAIKNDFWTKAEGGYPTYSMWKLVGLDHIKTLGQLAAIQSSEQFKLYKRYAIEFDEHILRRFQSTYSRPTWFLAKDAPPVEIYARAQIWGERNREVEHVLEFLGLERASKEVLRQNPYFQHYLKNLPKA
ncbi:hypothetical protein L916_19691 [Phytophthora nicotianae]|uniref:RxLR effector protein n=1 Tax=Phytophthora nicotianae TaxID=4792 RepID=W2HZX0_PHYNI|nr:hypothetical protein L916_19691 [Phytophthora nicotianae]